VKLVVQRVTKGSVTVDNKIVGKIDNGLLVFLGVSKDDTTEQADFLIDKMLNLRIFEDSEEKMNLSSLDINAELLIISQFTLYGDTKKGRRPNFSEAAPLDLAENLYNYFVENLKKVSALKVETGIFRAYMQVEIHNDGPVTFILEK